MENKEKERNVALTNTCLQCKKQITVIVNNQDFLDWQEGTLIQNAFPYLNDEEREFLISEYCGRCFDNLFEVWE